MKSASAFLCLALLALAFASPETKDAALYNAKLADSLLGAENACGAVPREPSLDDIFEVGEIRIVSLLPQVGNSTSDLANASLLWGYSAKAPSSASFELANDRCPPGKIQLYSPSGIELRGALLEKSFCGKNSTHHIGAGENPLPLSLGGCEGDRSRLFEPLFLEIRGKLSARYSYRMDYYDYGCVFFGNNSGCGCYSRLEFGMRTFEREVSHSASFDVEVGENGWFWINPPLGFRLEGKGNGKLALLEKRMPSEIILQLGSGKTLRASAYRYNVSQGACGEKRVEREFSPGGDFSINASPGGNPIQPYQLMGKNATVLPIYIEFDFDAGAGRQEFSLLENDSFGFVQRHSRNFTVRAPGPAQAQGGALGEGRGMRITMASEKETASASASSPQAPGKAPEWAAFAILLLLPFAIGARALFSGRGES